MAEQWFRSWHGAPTDPKWLLIARKAKVEPGMVSAIVWALLDHASQAGERGDIIDFDVETYATFSGFAEEQIEAVIKALRDKGVIDDGRLAAWDKRQPKREDSSTERSRAFRERKKHEAEQATQSNAETEAATVATSSNAKPDPETQCNAVQRDATQGNAREEEIREEEKREEEKREEEETNLEVSSVARIGRSQRRRDPDASPDFERFRAAYPKRTGSNPWVPAGKLFAAAVKGGTDPQAIITGAVMYADELKRTGKLGSEHVAQAKTWLNQQRWKDYPEQLEAGVDQPAANGATAGKFYAKSGSRQLEAWDAHNKRKCGKSYPRDMAGGWWVETEWPPGHEPKRYYAEAGSPQLGAWDAYRRGFDGKSWPRDDQGGCEFDSEWPPEHEQTAARASNGTDHVSDSPKVNGAHQRPSVGHTEAPDSNTKQSPNADLLAELSADLDYIPTQEKAA